MPTRLKHGVDTAASTNNLYDTTSKTYGVNYKTSGGTVTTYGVYQVHSFLTSGNTNFVAGGSDNVDVLVVAGGGGAGTGSGGGGGAGGFRTSASHAVTAQTYVVTVGSGGVGGTYGGPGDPADYYRRGFNGGDSVFDTITSTGGGGGMGYTPQSGPQAGQGGATGGSGGGSGTTGQGYNPGNGGAGNTPSTSPAQGFAGGTGQARGYPGAPNVNYYGGGGGGGGASEVGVDACNMPNCGYGGDGGDGVTNDYRTGSNVTYAGGGSAAGGRHYPPSPETYSPVGTAGAGGGGQSVAHDSAYNGIYNPATYGTANTGGGGGGGAGGNWGGYGGSGIVVVRFPSAGALGGRGNMTLLSNAQTAQADPAEGRLMLYEEDVDAITLDTDLKGYVSRDGGTTYTQTPLVDDGDVQIIPAVDNTGGIDASTKLMLHMDGANDGTTFTDSSASAHSLTAYGGTHTDTAVKKFGTASAQFDGAGDTLACPDSADWDFGTGDLTIDCWVRGNDFASPSARQTVIDIAGFWIHFETAGYMAVATSTSGAGTIFLGADDQTWSDDTWYHLAVVRSGNTWTLYQNGTSIATATESGTFDSSAQFLIGNKHITTPYGETYWDGFIDEFRISKGVARWTANFTSPTAPYTSGSYVEPVLARTVRLLSGSVNIAGQPAGTDMKYKVETLNNKNLKLHGASLLWA